MTPRVAVDSKLRACDVVALKVEDIAPSGYAADRVTIRQKKTGLPVRFEMTEQSRQTVDEYLRASRKKPGQLLFSSRRGAERSCNMLGSFRSGLPALVWIRTFLALIRFAEPKRH